MDSRGEFQHIPFQACNETDRPLQLVFGSETDIDCTIATLTDALFHLFEFYIHNDTSLTCRIPSFPRISVVRANGDGRQNGDYSASKQSVSKRWML